MMKRGDVSPVMWLLLSIILLLALLGVVLVLKDRSIGAISALKGLL